MIIYGDGGHGKVIYYALSNPGVDVEHIFDDSKKDFALNDKIKVSSYSFLYYPDSKIFVSIGKNEVRKEISKKIQHRIGLLLSKHSFISEYSRIGRGSMILLNCIVHTGPKVGKHIILNTPSIIELDVRIKDFTHISNTAAIYSAVKIREGDFVEAGSTVKQGNNNSKWCTIIGIGSTVINDVSDFTIVAGNPAGPR